ncbi:MAG: VacB/RNase II family 3'-5' exoribonuclease, partial [Leptospira sp.]|nr:VacB/RNase II family 3'-5' exoribonuclease [Leptospira sp.]
MQPNQFQRARKIIDYLASKSGSSTTKQDLIKKFAPPEKAVEAKKKKPDKKKKKGATITNQRLSRLEELESVLTVLENEALIKTEKKTILIARPFSLIGKISLSARGDGFVKLPSGNEAYIHSSKTDTAIAGDRVEIYPAGVGRRERMEGEVIRIIQRGRVLYRMKVQDIEAKYIIGKLLDMHGEVKEGYLLKKALLEDNLKNIQKGDVLIVKLKESQAQEPNFYEVSFVRFESDTKEDPDFLRVMMKYNFEQNHPDTISLDFPEEVNEKTVHDWNARVDLRELYSVTIDGATAKDFDDAISFVNEGKRVRFWVHIADVSHYVRQGSAMDDEAYRRATSVYLSNRVIPMLPPVLSENLCSLVSNVNRLAFTVEMEADHSGKIFSAKCYKSIIKVSKRYTYEMAEEEILAADPKNWMVQLNEFAWNQRKHRMELGRVDLNLKESSMVIGADFVPTSIQNKERLKSHILVEEMMLSANTMVANFLRKKKASALNRIHEVMDEEKLEALNNFLKLNSYNMQLKSSDYGEIKKVLDKLAGDPNEKVFNYLLLRSFMQAYYGPEYIGHWGLGFKDYCHFTSPIRRYPDLIVHRALHSAILEEQPPYAFDELQKMGLHCSEEERKASDAERDIFKLKAIRYLESTGKKEFTAYITGYKPNFVFLELDDPMMEAIADKTEFTNEFELTGKNAFSFYSKKY